jgi:hypothetical protein
MEPFENASKFLYVIVKGTGGKYKYVVLINNDGDHVDE